MRSEVLVMAFMEITITERTVTVDDSGTDERVGMNEEDRLLL